MKVSKNTSKNIFLTSWISINPVEASAANVNPLHHVAANSIWDFLRPVRNWLDNIQVSDSL